MSARHDRPAERVTLGAWLTFRPDRHSPYFWHNGHYPESEEYRALADDGFADYRLRIHGLVADYSQIDGG